MSSQEYTLIGGSNDGVRVTVPNDTRVWQIIDRREERLCMSRMDYNLPAKQVRVEKYEKLKAIIDGVEITWLVLEGLELITAIQILYNRHRPAVK